MGNRRRRRKRRPTAAEREQELCIAKLVEWGKSPVDAQAFFSENLATARAYAEEEYTTLEQAFVEILLAELDIDLELPHDWCDMRPQAKDEP